MASPPTKTLTGTVIPPVAISIALPASAATKVYALLSCLKIIFLRSPFESLTVPVTVTPAEVVSNFLELSW